MLEQESSEIFKSTPVVEKVDVKRFREIAIQYPDAKDIDQATFAHIDAEDAVTNGSASPCAIVWEFDRLTGKMKRSGHFPEVSRRKDDEIDKEGLQNLDRIYGGHPVSDEDLPNTPIQAPNAEESFVFGNSPIFVEESGLPQFKEMGKEIAAEIKKTHRDDTKAFFLFGQNIDEEEAKEKDEFTLNQTLIDNTLEQFELTTEIRAWGVREADIHDFRETNSQGSDFTIYVQSENKIYHYHRNPEDEFPHIEHHRRNF